MKAHKLYIIGWGVAFTAGLLIGFYCIPPILSPDIDRALNIVSEGRASHQFSIPSDFHSKWIENYDHLESVIRSLR